MVSQIKGPAIFLAQFIVDQAPFDSLENITRWAAGLGYKGVQIPTIDKRVFDLELAVSSVIHTLMRLKAFVRMQVSKLLSFRYISKGSY